MNGNDRIEDDNVKADLLNHVFASTFAAPTVPNAARVLVHILDQLQCFHISTENVRVILRAIHSGKSCGPENVSARVIRCAVRKM